MSSYFHSTVDQNL